MELNYKKSEYFSQDFVECISLFFQTESVSRASMGTYMSRLRTICNELKKDFLEITEDDVDRYFSNLRSLCMVGKGKKSSVYSKWACYNRIGEYISQLEGYLGSYSNPFSCISLDAPTGELNFHRIPTMADVDKLLSKAPNRTYYLVFVLAFRTAMAVSEIVDLRKSSFSRSEGRLFVQTGAGGKKKLLPLPEDVALLVEKHIDAMDYSDSEGHLFYNKYNNVLHEVNIRKCFKSILSKLNLDSTYSIKDLRNRCILDMIAASGDSGEALSTVGDYAGIGSERLRILEKSAAIIRNNPADLVHIRVNDFSE